MVDWVLKFYHQNKSIFNVEVLYNLWSIKFKRRIEFEKCILIFKWNFLRLVKNLVKVSFSIFACFVFLRSA